MKVLLINSVCGIRSTGRICTDIADILRFNGDECKIAYGRENVPSEYEDIAVRIGTNAGVNVHAVMSRLLDNTGHGSIKATQKFIEWVDEYDPDIIHLHNLHGYYINLELLFDYLKKVQKPVVWTLHDCWAFTGHCAHFDYIGCEKWKNGGCYNCPQKKKYPTSLLVDRSRNNFLEKKRWFNGLENMTIVTPSKWLADLVRCSFLKEHPVKVIHNGIDLSIFKPLDTGTFRKKYGLQDKTVFLGAATAWNESKGLYDFYKMNEMKSENEVIVLVGLTQKQINALPEGIVGIKRTNSTEELADIYSTVDVFVNPTYEDTYPTVNLEAQACGTPVVTYRTGGSPEAVYEKNIVEKGDSKALISRARELVRTSPIINAISLSKDECYSKYIELYRTIRCQ